MNNIKQESRVEQWLNKILQGDCIEGLRLLPDNCVDTVVTSPPYY